MNNIKKFIRKIILEQLEEVITIEGYHGSGINNLSKENLGIMTSDIVRAWSHHGSKFGGFYITMPKDIDLNTTTNIIDSSENFDIAKKYAKDSAAKLKIADPTNQNIHPTVYKIKIKLPKNKIKVSSSALEFTRVTNSIIEKLLNEGILFIYKQKGIPTAEGIVLDKNIIEEVKEVWSDEN